MKKNVIRVREIKDNIKRIFKNQPLTRNLSVLNGYSDFKKEYEKAWDLKHKKENKARREEFCKRNKEKMEEYNQRPEIKARRRKQKNDYIKQRRKNDLNFAIASRLRASLKGALKRYSKTRKITTSKKYGINYEKIIEHLKPFPKDIKNYHVDHIKPLCSFDLNNLKEVKKAFDKNNLQWLTAKENMKKGSRFL